MASGTIDYDMVQAWIKQCAYHHGCRKYLSHTDIRAKSIRVPGFKLIDCRMGTVVLADSIRLEDGAASLQYIALSYVWGDTHTREHTKRVFPKTIQDSICVVLALGYQYLWVDRYVSYLAT